MCPVACPTGPRGYTAEERRRYVWIALLGLAAGSALFVLTVYVKADLSDRLLLNEALAAAGRGVTVRLPLDDIGVKSNDGMLLALASRPNAVSPYPLLRSPLPTQRSWHFPGAESTSES